MDQAIKAEWVRRLREPYRKQGAGKLRNVDGGQCCLDILCEMAVEAGVISPPTLDKELGVFVYNYHVEGVAEPAEESETLPPPVVAWSGTPDMNPDVEFENPRYEGPAAPDEPPFDAFGEPRRSNDCLAELNDTWQFTFPEIAQIIEDSDL